MEFPSDESDSDFEPEIKIEQKKAEIAAVDLEKAKRELETMKQEIKKEEIKLENQGLSDALQYAQRIKESQSLKKPENVKAKFAGESLELLPTKRNRASLDQLAKELSKKKSITSLTKSKLDWEKFKEKNNLEDELAQNRKDGFLGKRDFLDIAREREKDRLSELKRKRN